MKPRLLLGSAIFALACAEQPIEYTTALEPIVNGELAAPGQFPAVGMISFGGSLCTGTLIQPDWVVTAAHCTSGQSATSTTFNIGNGFGNFTKTVQAKKLFTHPKFDPNQFFVGNDIALIELAEPITDIAPIALNTEPLENLLDFTVQGCDLTKNCFTAVGFGDTDGGAGDAGTKRFVDIQLDSINNEHINFGSGPGGNTCQGDSGGPSFMTLNGQLRVIAVTSGGAVGCQGSSFSERTDSEFAEFLQPTIDGSIVPEPEHCVLDEVCEDVCGLTDPDCHCARDGFCEGVAACPPQIDKDPDCPDNTATPPDEGCAVSSPAPSSAPFTIFGLVTLAFASLGLIRRRKS